MYMWAMISVMDMLTGDTGYRVFHTHPAPVVHRQTVNLLYALVLYRTASITIVNVGKCSVIQCTFHDFAAFENLSRVIYLFPCSRIHCQFDRQHCCIHILIGQPTV